jgi:hypothetical protein
MKSQKRTFHVALVFGMVLASVSVIRAENRFYVSDASILEGSTNNVVEVEADLDVAITAFSVRLRYNPGHIRVTSVHAGTDVQSVLPDVFVGYHDLDTGEVYFGGLFDQDNSGLKVLQPGTGRSLLILVFDVLAPIGTVTQVDLFNSVGGPPDFYNAITDINADASILPALDSGEITVSSSQIFADAGGDRMVAENAPVVLDGSGSFTLRGTNLTYFWQQLSGPPLSDISGQNANPFEFTVPPVFGETPSRSPSRSTTVSKLRLRLSRSKPWILTCARAVSGSRRGGRLCRLSTAVSAPLYSTAN